MRIFSDMDLCEQLGSGMKKILRAYPQEIFHISEHFIDVMFTYSKEALNILKEQSVPTENVGVKLTKTENAALELIKKIPILWQNRIPRH